MNRAEKILDLLEAKIKWGFDLTRFKSADDWKKILKAVGVSPKAKQGKEPLHGWIWKGKNIEIATANNPITGEYADPKLREPEIGYASYIGITGAEELVKKVVKMIKDLGAYEEESPNARDYI